MDLLDVDLSRLPADVVREYVGEKLVEFGFPGDDVGEGGTEIPTVADEADGDLSDIEAAAVNFSADLSPKRNLKSTIVWLITRSPRTGTSVVLWADGRTAPLLVY